MIFGISFHLGAHLFYSKIGLKLKDSLPCLSQYVMTSLMRDNITLDEIATLAMTEKGFISEFPPQAIEQSELTNSPASPTPITRDLRHLLWVSIDNDDSRDLDQLT